MSAAAEAMRWNEYHPIGVYVRYWRGERSGPGVLSRTRTEAWVMPSGTAVVLIAGCSGAIALSHVEPAVAAPATEEEKP